MARVGTILSIGSDTAFGGISDGNAMVWTSEVLIGSGEDLWAASPNGDRITVPAALNGLQGEVFAWVKLTGSTLDLICSIYKNGFFTVPVTKQGTGNLPQEFMSMRTGPLELATNDYFEIYGDTGTLLAAEASFAFVTNDRLGFVSAAMAADVTAPGTLLTLEWASPTIDNLVTYNGPSEFQVPTGAVAAIVSLVSYNSSGPEAGCEWQLHVNGVAVRTAPAPSGTINYGPGPLDFGVIAVSPLDDISIVYDGACDLQAANVQIGIEWI